MRICWRLAPLRLRPGDIACGYSFDPARKRRILDYNEDDCRAMRVLLDALRGLPVRRDP